MAFEDREVSYGDVTFRIGKLLPMEAKEVFMRHVRPLLEGALSANADAGFWGMVLGVLSKAPQEHYDATMRALYQQIMFTSPATPQPMVLASNAELAFKDLEAAHILLLEARAFYVNFRGSLDVLRSELPFLAQLFQPSEPEI